VADAHTVRGKQREPVNIDLVIQAIITLGEQYAAEERGTGEAAEGRTTLPCRPKEQAL